MRTAQICLKNRSKIEWFSFYQFLCPNTKLAVLTAKIQNRKGLPCGFLLQN